jgi:hypothetical protein
MPNDYNVGYGKPPKGSQFSSGKSGNPKGRPKGSKNIATLFNQITLELIQVKENGRTKTMTRLEAVLLQMTNRALSGDPRTMREFVQFSRLFQEAESNEPGTSAPSERDAAVMASLLKRMKRAESPVDGTEDVQPEIDNEEPGEEGFHEEDEEDYA